jgi:anti-sigma regulatory factor (Ser/Thr protein kinase)
VTTARQFRCRPEDVTAARLFVREQLSDELPETLQAAELMTSELATNCVMHARSDFELAIDSHGQIRIEVSDAGRGRPTLLQPDVRDPTGRGLRIVDAMSDAWGVVAKTKGKTVWFTLPPPPHPET